MDGDLKVVGDYTEGSQWPSIKHAPDPYPTDNNRPNSGAAYVSKMVDGTWVKNAKLKAPNGGDNDMFGHSVSISGTISIANSTASRPEVMYASDR